MNRILVILAMLYFPLVFSQTKEEKLRATENQELLSEAEESLKEGDFSTAEANYRRIIARDPKNTKAKYNLGNAYYAREKNREAGKRYIEAAEVATSKAEKHKIYHNLGNVFMNEKKYREAVEAYKNALRNNPTDDETRYNLALAKKMLEEQGDDGGGDDEEDEQEDEKDEGENEEDENQGDEGQDNEDKGDESEDEKEQNAEDKDDEGEPKEQESQGQPQPAEGKLSPQQIQSLLEAMNNEEKKVQDKINAEKQKGVKVKPEKDW